MLQFAYLKYEAVVLSDPTMSGEEKSALLNDLNNKIVNLQEARDEAAKKAMGDEGAEEATEDKGAETAEEDEEAETAEKDDGDEEGETVEEVSTVQ